jgi:FSR family fosmidomycin resistance protein-like MFS transporter
MKIAPDVLAAIGNTPLIKLKHASEATGCTILGKAEFMNPGGSVKDRAALAIVQDAIAKGQLQPGGMIVDAIGKKGYLMAASLFWVGFPYALMSLTHSMWMLVVCVMLVGIGNNLWHPAAIPTLAHQYPQRKGLVLSFHGMGGNVGEALAPLAAGALLAWFSWRAVVVINIVPGLVMAALIVLLVGALNTSRAEDDHVNAGSKTPWSFRQYLSDLMSLIRDRALPFILFRQS